MTLRARLLSALLAASFVVAGAFGAVVVQQHGLLLRPIDAQLRPLAQNLAEAEVFYSNRPPLVGRDMSGPPARELYVAIHEAGIAPTLLAIPAKDPTFAPKIDVEDLASHPSTDQPFTVEAIDGGGARIIAHDLGAGRWVIAAMSTRTVAEAQSELLATATVVLVGLLLAFSLIVYVVDRFGIKPILEVTRAAEELASSRSHPRVSVEALTTEAGRLGLSFNKMLDAQQDAETRQRRFVADVSHELRTPLTTLQGYTALYASAALTTPEQIDDAMRRIGSEAKRMGRLVDELLTMASLDESRPITRVDVDLDRLLHDLASDAAAIQPDRRISTSVEPDLTISADVELLTQALTATIHNALRHTPTSASLTLRAARQGSTVEIDVADRGQGIDPSHIDHIFDRFYRPQGKRGRATEGTGLGLAIAKSVTEAHNGTIHASSSAKAGTTIIFKLPVCESGSAGLRT